MAIRPRDGKWQVDVTYKGVREFATCDSQEEARVEEARVLDRLVQSCGNKNKKVCWTLKFASDQVMKMVWKGSRSEKTNERNLKCIREFFGDETRLDEITTVRVDDYKNALKVKGNTAGTINRKLMVLSKVFTHAIPRDGVARKPKMELEDKPPGRIRVLSEDEEIAIYCWCGQRNELDLLEVIVCLVDLGFRESELFAVLPVDVHEHSQTVTTWLNKTDKPRTIPCSPRVWQIVADRLKKTKATNSRLFPFTEDWLTGKWRRIRTHLKLQHDKGFTPYCLRHTTATRLVQRDVPIKIVKEWLGHKKIETTEIYVHLQPNDLLRYANKAKPADTQNVLAGPGYGKVTGVT